MAIQGAKHVICSDKPTSECVGSLKEVLHKLYKSCVDASGEDTPCPLTCGTDEEYKE
jgi:hypothetical protein